MFRNINFNRKEPIYEQLYNYIKNMLEDGMLSSSSKLPSTREISENLNISRNTVVRAYEILEAEGYIYTIKGKGSFVSEIKKIKTKDWNVSWEQAVNSFAKKAEELDIMKNEAIFKKGMISFKSIAPDESLFDIEEFKKAFLDRMSLEGEKLLNYGYAQGYKPLINYLMDYMNKKGVSTRDRDILITNGFTEGFDIVLSTLTNKGDRILCEDPTHNTAIKIMKLQGIDIHGIALNKEGIDENKLKEELNTHKFKFAFFIPSYHNPTGMVMSYKKRENVYNILREYNVPIIEDGFNEELQHSGSHIAPIASIGGEGNGVIYIGSLSKILFPGLRIGWIFGDKRLIDILQSVKRSRNIHTSFLDQALLYQYMKNGSFEKYLKKARSIYKSKYNFTKELIEKYIPHEYILGDGGLYVYIKLKGISSRELLKNCFNRGVIFTPADIFYVNKGGYNELRLSFSRVSFDEIEKGIKIIGEEVKKLKNNVDKSSGN